MSASDPTPSDEMLDEAATAWLCEREEGFAPGREHAFATWRESNPRHEAAVRRVQHMLALLDDLPQVRAPLEDRIGRAEPTLPQGGRALRFPRWAWATGIAAALVVGWFASQTGPQSAPDPVRYTSNSTGQQRIGLSDGSLVDLNSSSEIRVAFNERERRVTLTAGEAHFDIAHDVKRPFIVAAGDVSVRAVGTAFNVKLAADSIDVLVIEGQVEVSRTDTVSAASQAASPLVVAGEQTRVRRDDPATTLKVEKVADDSIRTRLAWQHRMIPFVDLPLRDLLIQFNRRNTTQIVLDDPALGERRVGGMISMDRIDVFLRLLEQDGGIVIERGPSDTIVLRRAR